MIFSLLTKNSIRFSPLNISEATCRFRTGYLIYFKRPIFRTPHVPNRLNVKFAPLESPPPFASPPIVSWQRLSTSFALVRMDDGWWRWWMRILERFFRNLTQMWGGHSFHPTKIHPFFHFKKWHAVPNFHLGKVKPHWTLSNEKNGFPASWVVFYGQPGQLMSSGCSCWA